MSNKNPSFSDNVNITKTHPLTEFLKLSVGALVLIISMTVILFFSMQWVAPFIPFSFEEKLASSFDFEEVEGDNQNNNHNRTSEKRELYLQQLGDDLAEAQALPEDMSITIHWMESDVVNAFATLGGHVFITQALWEKMPSENALSMVIAHEIAHVKHRDPMKGLGAGVALSIITGLIFGEENAGMSIIGSGGLITSLHFTRSMESEADREALKTLNNYYGHVAGSTDFFESILEEDRGAHLEFLQTHPMTRGRIEDLEQQQKNNNWSKKSVKPLPDF